MDRERQAMEDARLMALCVWITIGGLAIGLAVAWWMVS